MEDKIVGVGTDIIEIERIRKVALRFKERFIDHLFTEKEALYCQRYRDPIPHFAGRFAAKEAVAKAIGTGLNHERYGGDPTGSETDQGHAQINWKEIEIINDPLGKPEVFLSERLKKMWHNHHFFLTISHSKEFATAFVILTKRAHESS